MGLTGSGDTRQEALKIESANSDVNYVDVQVNDCMPHLTKD